MDQKIVLELDRKVADQQSTLEKAGVAGFYVTTNPQVSASGLPWHSPGNAGSQRPNSLWALSLVTGEPGPGCVEGGEEGGISKAGPTASVPPSPGLLLPGPSSAPPLHAPPCARSLDNCSLVGVASLRFPPFWQDMGRIHWKSVLWAHCLALLGPDICLWALGERTLLPRALASAGETRCPAGLTAALLHPRS